MEAGFARMNALIIIQTSQGLASYLLESVPETKTKGFVIGYDGRHNSLDFAKLTAAAFVSKGIKVWWFEDLVHTPLVPFAVNMFQAAGGVMVTASHVGCTFSSSGIPELIIFIVVESSSR